MRRERLAHLLPLQILHPGWEGRCKATWKREFKLPWREAGPPNHHDDQVDSDQQVCLAHLLPLQILRPGDNRLWIGPHNLLRLGRNRLWPCSRFKSCALETTGYERFAPRKHKNKAMLGVCDQRQGVIKSPWREHLLLLHILHPGAPFQRSSSQFKNHHFAAMCSGSEEGSYLRLIDLCIIQL